MERFLTRSAVQLFLIREKNNKTQILLQKRQNCWSAGMWDSSASGHVEINEPMTLSLQREAEEEINIRFNKSDILFVNMQHSFFDNTAYYNGYFFIEKFIGKPTICEPKKCSELKWFDINKLPKNIIENRLQAIKDYINKISFTEFGWQNDEKIK